jgi:hypothetical protein
MDQYVPVSGSSVNLDMNQKKILGVDKAGGLYQDEVVNYQCMQEYVQS